MKRAIVGALVAAGLLYGAYRAYNSIFLQAVFIEDFYANIVDVPFDVTEKGASITVPLDGTTTRPAMTFPLPSLAGINWKT